MEKLHRQVLRARRRLILQQFFRIIGWWLLLALLVAAAAVAVPKIWVMGFSTQASTIWLWSWLGGTAAVATLLAMFCAWWARRNVLEAAIEIDQRFALRERVSSSLALGPQERESEAGQALIGDASRRIQRIAVSDKFRVRPTWRLLLPLLPAVVLVVLVLWVNDAKQGKSAVASPVQRDVKKQIETTAKKLKEKIAERKKKAEEDGLAVASGLFDRLEEGVEGLTKKEDVERKDASIKLNDLSKEIKLRRDALGGTDQVKERLNKLGDIDKGPADKVADALKDGDFNKAMDELQALQDKIEQGDLTDKDKQELADQMNQMKDKMQQMCNAHRDAKQQLEQQIEQQAAQGNMDQVNKLQQQLDQLNQQQQQMDQMQQLADQMGQCGDCMQNGDMQNAAAQLDQMAQAMQGLQQQVDEMEMLDGALDQIADAKNAMNCGQCGGKGCGACQGQQPGMGLGKGEGQGPPGPGMGEGQGAGWRPEKKTDTAAYDTRIPADPGPGAAVKVGRIHGPNIAGEARETIKSEIEAGPGDSDRAMSMQKLPKSQREHAQQYFDMFREGEK
jgi:hypothetical protein